MKTKVFKSVLPVFAMLIAVGMSFATDTVREVKTAYYQDPILGVQSTFLSVIYLLTLVFKHATNLIQTHWQQFASDAYLMYFYTK